MKLNLVSTQEVAEKNGVTERWIQQFCKDGKIEGATRLSGTGMWLVPKD